MYLTLGLYIDNNSSASSLFNLFIICTSTLLFLFISSCESCAKTISPILLVANNPVHINDNVIIAFFI